MLERPVSIESKESLPENPEEKILRTYEVEWDREIQGGANECRWIKLKNDGSGIFKPASGEATKITEEVRRDAGSELREKVKKGTYYKHERAAWLIDSALNWDMVPTTVIREVDGKVGSFQKHAPGLVAARTDWKKIPETQLKKLFVLDYILYSSDRRAENLLVDGKKVHAIDNGLVLDNDFFAPYIKLNPDDDDPPASFYRTAIIPKLAGAVKKFLNNPEAQQKLRSQLLELVTEYEVDACFARMKHVVELAKHKEGLPHFDFLEFYPPIQ